MNGLGVLLSLIALAIGAVWLVMGYWMYRSDK
jgi:hypothetical protein